MKYTEKFLNGYITHEEDYFPNVSNKFLKKFILVLLILWTLWFIILFLSF